MSVGMENDMQKQWQRVVYGIIGMLLLLGLDQASKYLAVAKLKNQAAFPLIPGVFELQYLENHGAAFGILQGKQIILLAFTVVIFAALLVIYMRIPDGKRYVPLGIVCILVGAGALGNMIDRFLYGYVVDFFYFRLIDFPIFNVADCYVTLSCIFIILLVFFFYKEEELSFLWNKKTE